MEARQDRSDGDRALERLGLFRIPVPVPFPQAGGPVNVTVALEEDGGLAFLDAGLGTPEAEGALREGLAARGFSFAQARRILLTHGHVDHYGLTQVIRDESGASVRIHPADRRKVADDDHSIGPEYGAFLLRCGCRPEDLTPMLAMGGATGRFARTVAAPVGELAGGQRYRFARCEATVVELPGHTPGLCGFHVRPLDGDGPTVFVASDHLLETVSPNPILELTPDGRRFPALPTYLASLARLVALDADWILPGHGPLFSDHRAVIRHLEAFYERRLTRTLERLPPDGASPAELVWALFPPERPEGRPAPDASSGAGSGSSPAAARVPPERPEGRSDATSFRAKRVVSGAGSRRYERPGPAGSRSRGPETFLMLGEVLGYLDVLGRRGLVEVDEQAGALRYRPVRGP